MLTTSMFSYEDGCGVDSKAQPTNQSPQHVSPTSNRSASSGKLTGNGNMSTTLIGNKSGGNDVSRDAESGLNCDGTVTTAKETLTTAPCTVSNQGSNAVAIRPRSGQPRRGWTSLERYLASHGRPRSRIEQEERMTRTSLERYLAVVSVVLLVTCIILVLVAALSHTPTPDFPNVCTTEHCVLTAAQILDAVDFSVDPCDDFYQFACGSWNRKHIIPEDKTGYNMFEQLHDDLQVILKRLLEEPPQEHDTNATKKAKILYESCTNTREIQSVGDQPLRDVIDSLGGWPVLEPDWLMSRSDWTLEKMLGQLRGRHETQVLVVMWVAADDKNSSANVIQLDQPNLGMPSREYYLMEGDEIYKNAYLRYMINVAKMFGADEVTAERDMTDVLRFEERLANVTIPESSRHDTSAIYTKMTLRQLQQDAPEINWLAYFNSFMPMNITEDELVVSMATEYLKSMARLVGEENKRVLANYMMWLLLMDLAPETTEEFKRQEMEYLRILQGVTKEQVRWQKCVEFVNDHLGMAVGRMFIQANFQKQSKDMAIEMIHNIRAELVKILEESDWMDLETQIVAKEKAYAMVERIGYPEFLFNDTELDDMYKEITVEKDKFFMNTLAVKVYESTKDIVKLRQPVDKNKWEQHPAIVNAFYNPNTNEIAFPAGILQPIFYSHHFPKYLNYGGIGVVIGHEITHGFDDKGRQYDKDGNLRQWWKNDTIRAFRDRMQCLVDQYSGYKLDQIGLYVDGKNTQGENIADNGGLKESFRAYRAWVRRNGEEPLLPGINLTHNQLFFLKYAQIWCGIVRDEEALQKLRTAVHSPSPIRVIGPLSNSVDFAEAYNCPPNSKMNPEKKCLVW